MTRGMTIEAAAEKFARDCNIIPREMIERVISTAPEEWHEVTAPGTDGSADARGPLPAWDGMWSFRDPVNDWWLENRGGIRKMSECGFRIYRHDRFGYFFGVDDTEADFFTRYWMPLYIARDLNWHDPGTDDSGSNAGEKED